MKLYDIVIVQRDGFRHFGEILSRITPKNTFMVRMVPGHSGTLIETPADKLCATDQRIRWIHYAQVDGRGSFPIDMLRYDFAAPLNFDPVTKEIDPSFGFTDLIVCQASGRGHPTWAQGRWNSFLWGLKELPSLPFTGALHT